MEKYERELDKIDELIDKLTDISESDKVITKEEQAILDKIMVELGNYRALILEVLDDQKVSEEAIIQIEKFKKSMLTFAEETALQDGTLSPDERDLIGIIKHFVES